MTFVSGTGRKRGDPRHLYTHLIRVSRDGRNSLVVVYLS